jgi:hypothetical protein
MDLHLAAPKGSVSNAESHMRSLLQSCSGGLSVEPVPVFVALLLSPSYLCLIGPSLVEVWVSILDPKPIGDVTKSCRHCFE